MVFAFVTLSSVGDFIVFIEFIIFRCKKYDFAVVRPPSATHRIQARDRRMEAERGFEDTDIVMNQELAVVQEQLVRQQQIIEALSVELQRLKV